MHPSENGFYPNSPCYAEFYGPQCLSIECGDMAKARLDKCLLTHNEIDPASDSYSFTKLEDRLKLRMPSSDLIDFLDFSNPRVPQTQQDSIVSQLTVDVLIPSLEPQTITPLELEQTRSEKIETIFVPQITERFTIQREKSNGKLEKFIMFGVIGLALFLLK